MKNLLDEKKYNAAEILNKQIKNHPIKNSLNE